MAKNRKIDSENKKVARIFEEKKALIVIINPSVKKESAVLRALRPNTALKKPNLPQSSLFS